jgi:hypothetical protein
VTADRDPAKKSADMGRALKRRRDKIRWSAHRGRQAANHFGFKPGDCPNAGRHLRTRICGELREIKPRRPCLGKRGRRRTRKPGELFDRVKVPEVGGQHFSDSCFERVGIYRL